VLSPSRRLIKLQGVAYCWSQGYLVGLSMSGGPAVLCILPSDIYVFKCEQLTWHVFKAGFGKRGTTEAPMKQI
jgi:hypothetical protein